MGSAEIMLERLIALEKQYTAKSDKFKYDCARGAKCVGSDRMQSPRHNYGPCYASWFSKVLQQSKKTGGPISLAEIGILSGSGIAVWSTIFPDAAIHGFDYFLNNTKHNLPFLKSRGAFKHGGPILHQFDQLAEVPTGQERLRLMFPGEKFEVVIDDGLHTDQSIINTFLMFKEFVKPGGLYVIEDLKGCYLKRRKDVKEYMSDLCEKKMRQEMKMDAIATDNGFTLHTCKADARWFVLVRSAPGDA